MPESRVMTRTGAGRRRLKFVLVVTELRVQMDDEAAASKCSKLIAESKADRDKSLFTPQPPQYVEKGLSSSDTERSNLSRSGHCKGNYKLHGQ